MYSMMLTRLEPSSWDLQKPVLFSSAFSILLTADAIKYASINSKTAFTTPIMPSPNSLAKGEKIVNSIKTPPCNYHYNYNIKQMAEIVYFVSLDYIQSIKRKARMVQCGLSVLLFKR